MTRDPTLKQSKLYIRTMLDDGLRLLTVVKIQLKDQMELTALIEETYSSMENLRGKWRKIDN